MYQIKRLLFRIELFNNDIIAPDNQLTLDEQKEISSQISKLKDILLRINNPCQDCPGNRVPDVCINMCNPEKCKVDKRFTKFVKYDDELIEEYNRWYDQHFRGDRNMWTDGEYLTRSSQTELARHFAQWGATHSKEIEL